MLLEKLTKKAEESEDLTTYTFTFSDTDGSKQSFTLCGDDCVLLDQKIYHATGAYNVLNAAYLSVEDDESLMGDLDFEDSLAQTEEEENEPQEQENDADADTNAEEGTDYGDYTVFSSEPMEFSFLYLSSWAKPPAILRSMPTLCRSWFPPWAVPSLPASSCLHWKRTAP